MSEFACEVGDGHYDIIWPNGEWLRAFPNGKIVAGKSPRGNTGPIKTTIAALANRATALEEAARVMDERAAMYRAKADELDPLGEGTYTQHEVRLSNAEASEWGAAAIRQLSSSPDEGVAS